MMLIFVIFLLVGLFLCRSLNLSARLFIQAYLLSAILSYGMAWLNIVTSGDPFAINSIGDGSDDRAYFLGLSKPFNFTFTRSYYIPFLKVLLAPFSYFFKTSIFDALVVNIFFHSFGALFIYKFLYCWIENSKSSRFGFYIYLFCPALIGDGLVLMREGLVASSLIFVMYCFYFSIFRYFVLWLVFLSMLRPAAGLVVFIGLLSIYFWNFKNAFRSFKPQNLIIYIIFLGCLSFFLFPFLVEYLVNKEFTSIFAIRRDFIDDYASSSINFSFFNYAGSTDFFSRIVLFFYFLIAPLAPISNIKFNYPTETILALHGFWSVFTFKFLIDSYVNVIYTKSKIYLSFIKSNKIKNQIFFLILFFTLVLSIYSLQIRHKSMIFPLVVLLASYGFYRANNKSKYLTWLLVFPLIALLFR